MRNLKKLFAVILVVAMMASFMIPAFAAPSDVVGSDIEDEVARLVALGIITGREDGKFYPSDTITRAEFAAVVIRALGYGSAADAAKGQTKFSDVKADFWASGYINLASSLGIIKGRPDGTFGANDKVLYEEAVTMIVRSLGYEPAAAANGGYPTGYLTIASQEDIDEDAVAAVGSPASRGLVAKLVDNSLEVAMMVQTGYGTEQKYVKSGTESTTKQTLLDTKLKLDIREATVQTVDLDKSEIKVKMSMDEKINGDDKGDVKTYDVFAGLSFVGLENADVTLWVKDGVVYNIETDTTVYYDYITKLDGEDDENDITVTLDTIEEITLLNAGTFDVKENTNGTAADFELYINNGSKETLSADADNVLLAGEVFAKVFVNDGLISRVEAYNIADGDVGLVTKVEDDTLTMTRGKDEGKKLSNLDDADSVNVYIDGAAKTYADLAEGMVVQYKIVADDYYFIASTKKVEGKLEAAKSGKAKIAGAYTDFFGSKFFSTDNGDSYEAIASETDLKDMLGTDVIGLKNYRGKIVYLTGSVESTTDFYGIVTSVNDFNDQIKVARDVEGELKTVTYDTDLPTSPASGFSSFSAVLGNYNSNKTGTVDARGEERKDLLYEFSLNADGEITKAKLIGTTQIADAQFNKDSDYVKNSADTIRIYTDDAVMFRVDGTDIELLKWKDIEGTTLATTSDLDLWYVTNDVTPEVMLFNDTNATTGDADTKIAFSTSDKFLGWITSQAIASGDDYEITMNTNGGEKTFTVDDGDLGSPQAAGEKRLAMYRLTSDENVVKIGVASYTYDQKNSAGTAIQFAGLDLSLLDDGANYRAISNAVVDASGVDSNTIKVNASGTTYALASDAVVYELDTSDVAYSISDITEVDEDGTNAADRSNVSFVTYKGKIKFLFFWD